MSTSSAYPDELSLFAQQAGQATAALASQVTQLLQAADAFRSSEADVDASSVNEALQKFLSDNGSDERFVQAVASAFTRADSGTLPDSVIAAELQAEGVSTSFASVPTIDDPVLKGLPLSSGWSNDPVCMATGHFAELEEDLAMPSWAGPLAWRRVYSSRFVVQGPLGRGWASWAGARLVERPGGLVEYCGPDGQVAAFVARHDGFLPNPGVLADLARTDSGLELRWRRGSRQAGVRWEFGRDGLLLSASQPGQGVVKARHEDGRLVALEHDGGRTLSLEWRDEQVRAVASSDGRRAEYRYDGADLVEVARPAGAVRYKCDAGGLVVEVHDADGTRLVHNTYDVEGRVLTQVSPLGRVTHFDYLGHLAVVVRDEHDGPRTLFRHDVLGRLVELTNAQGSRVLREHDQAGNLVRVVGPGGEETLQRFDGRGNLIWARQASGAEESYSYDGQGRPTSRTDAAGATFQLSYDGDEVVPCEVSGPLGWHEQYRSEGGRLVGYRDADGVGWDLEVGPEGEAAALVSTAGERYLFSWHRSGALDSVVTPSGGRYEVGRDDAGRATAVRSPSGATSLASWSEAGRLRLWVGPDGARTELGYNQAGKLAEVTGPTGATASLSYDLWGNLVAGRWPGGAQWQFGYDSMSQLTSVTAPDGAVWHQHWGASGQWLGGESPGGYWARRDYGPGGRLDGVELPGEGKVELGYDGAGRLARISWPDGGSATVERDVLGRVVAETGATGRRTYTYMAAGRLRSMTGRPGTWWFSYDGAGRLATASGPGGQRQEVGYDRDGRPVLATGPGEPEQVAAYDADGYLAELREGTTRWHWERDAAGRPLSVSRDGVAQVGYGRDAAGRLSRVTDALGGDTRFTLNELGEVVAMTDSKGATWAYERDQLGRVVAVTDPLGRRRSTGRDADGRPCRWEVSGPALDDGTTVSATGEVAYEWGADGRLRSVSHDGSQVWEAERSETGREAIFRGSGALSVREVRDDAGRLVRREVGERVTTWDWHPDGTEVDVVSPFGVRLTVLLDGYGRRRGARQALLGEVLVELSNDGRAVSLSAPGLSRQWSEVSDRLSRYHQEVGDSHQSVELERDSSGRVVREVDGAVVRAFAYDSAGQLVGFTGPAGEWSWDYDACGRLVREVSPEGTRDLIYDSADQLVEERGPRGTVGYAYDVEGRRVYEAHPDGEVRYTWDVLGQLTCIDDGRNGARFVLSHDASGRLAAVNGTPVDWDGNALLGLGGQLVVGGPGGPVALVGMDGAQYLGTSWRGDVQSEEAWAPWGHQGASGLSLGLLGELHVGPLVWLRNRAYDTATHAFTSRDPLSGLEGRPGGLTNAYAYAANDPVGFADPLGLQPMSMAQFNHWQAQERAGDWKTIVEWAAVAAVVVGGVALIVASGGAAAPVLFGMSTAAMETGAGVGALVGVGGAALEETIHGQPIDPADLLVGGLSGAVTGAAIPLAGALAAGMAGPAVLGAQMGAGALAGGGTSAIGQLVLTGRLNLGDVAISAGTGAFCGILPGADAPAASGANTSTADVGADTALHADPGTTPGESPGAEPGAPRTTAPAPASAKTVDATGTDPGAPAEHPANAPGDGDSGGGPVPRPPLGKRVFGDVTRPEAAVINGVIDAHTGVPAAIVQAAVSSPRRLAPAALDLGAVRDLEVAELRPAPALAGATRW